ncbi:MAG: hypothetical protein NDI66_03290, partial [Pseudomonas sp.]|nr:hypothetical protein [Pseudomonas sp.]
MTENAAAPVTITVARESAPGERRIAATPETCRKLIALGADVRVPRGAGLSASFVDEAYAQAGARLVDDDAAALRDADIVLCVQPPAATVLATLKPGATV